MKKKYSKCESALKINNEMKEAMEELKKENEILMCNEYEVTLQGLQQKVEDSAGKVEGAVCETKLEELRNAWKKEHEEEKVSFTEVVKKQIQENTKDTVIQVIKEKEVLVRDTVDKKKCMVFFRLQEKKNLVKSVREREEKELVRKIITLVQEEEWTGTRWKKHIELENIVKEVKNH